MAQSFTNAKRFFEKLQMPIDFDHCWIWTASFNRKGYGQFAKRENGKTIVTRAHCFAYELFYGPIPKGMCVCHDCPGGDNKACCNPKHLWLGTNKDNHRDMVKKGGAWWQNPNYKYPPRTPEQKARMAAAKKGELNAVSKLKTSEVSEIRRDYLTGLFLQRELAERYQISEGTIAQIVLMKIWKDVEPFITIEDRQRLRNKRLQDAVPRLMAAPRNPDGPSKASLKKEAIAQRKAQREEWVNSIRRDYAKGGENTIVSLSRKYNCSYRVIYTIVNNQVSQHINTEAA